MITLSGQETSGESVCLPIESRLCGGIRELGAFSNSVIPTSGVGVLGGWDRAQRTPGNPTVWGLIDQSFASVPVDPGHPSHRISELLRLSNLEWPVSWLMVTRPMESLGDPDRTTPTAKQVNAVTTNPSIDSPGH